MAEATQLAGACAASALSGAAAGVPRATWAHLTLRTARARAQLKYGTRASSGGGRSSARETIGRVAAGAIAEKWLFQTYGTRIVTWVNSVGSVGIPEDVVAEHGCGWTREEVDRLGALVLLRDPARFPIDLAALTGADAAPKAAELQRKADAEQAFLAAAEEDATPAYRDASGAIYTRSGALIASPPANVAGWATDDLVSLRCPHPPTACRMATLIRHVKAAKDSIGGTLTTMCTGVPPALGEPVFDRLEAKLAHAMLSLPATKGFEIGTGFRGARAARARPRASRPEPARQSRHRASRPERARARRAAVARRPPRRHAHARLGAQ